MGLLFAKTLKNLRTEKGLSQRELAELLFVTRSTVNRWENGSRLPDAAMLSRISRYLDVDMNTLLAATMESDEAPNIIMVDDSKIILTGSLPSSKRAGQAPATKSWLKTMVPILNLRMMANPISP